MKYLALYLAFSTIFAILGEEPWSKSWDNPVTNEVFYKNNTKENTQSLLSETLFKFYQKYISPIDGQTCHYLPSCSQYSYEALKKFGILRAILMTADRLIRCHPGQKEHPYDPPKLY